MPRPALVTRARWELFGANTPWKRLRVARRAGVVFLVFFAAAVHSAVRYFSQARNWLRIGTSLQPFDERSTSPSTLSRP